MLRYHRTVQTVQSPVCNILPLRKVPDMLDCLVIKLNVPVDICLLVCASIHAYKSTTYEAYISRWFR